MENSVIKPRDEVYNACVRHIETMHYLEELKEKGIILDEERSVLVRHAFLLFDSFVYSVVDERLGDELVRLTLENEDLSDFGYYWDKYANEEFTGKPVMVRAGGSWCLRYYAGNGEVFENGKKNGKSFPCDIAVPFEKFDPTDPEGSVKYNIT